MDLKKLSLRTISGLIYIAIIVGCILCGHVGIFILAVVLGVLATIEFSKICGTMSVRTIPTLLLDIAGCICLCFSVYIFPIVIWVFIMMARMIEELYCKAENPVRNLAVSMSSQIYIALPLSLMVVSGCIFGSVNILLAMFIFIWINDTGAFLTGSMLGRHRLFERISPKKSWEGFFGGLVFNLVAAWLFSRYCSEFFGITGGTAVWLGMAAIVTVFATWGDLIESLIKRTLKLKDSGNIIPGHGGILDRIDSLLLVSPAVFLYFMILDFLAGYVLI